MRTTRMDNWRGLHSVAQAVGVVGPERDNFVKRLQWLRLHLTRSNRRALQDIRGGRKFKVGDVCLIDGLANVAAIEIVETSTFAYMHANQQLCRLAPFETATRVRPVKGILEGFGHVLSTQQEVFKCCSCQLTLLLTAPASCDTEPESDSGRRAWGVSASTRLIPPLLSGLKKTRVNTPVCRLRHVLQEILHPSSVEAPHCESKWNQLLQLGHRNTREEWCSRWSVVSSSRVTGRQRALLWRILHLNIPLLSAPWFREFHQRPPHCLLCSQGSDETLTHIFHECPRGRRMWALIRPIAFALGLRHFESPKARLLGDCGTIGRAHLDEHHSAAHTPPVTDQQLLGISRQLWTSLRAIIVEAIWKARCNTLHNSSLSPAMALTQASTRVHPLLCQQLWFHCPSLAPEYVNWHDLPAQREHQKILPRLWLSVKSLVYNTPKKLAIY